MTEPVQPLTPELLDQLVKALEERKPNRLIRGAKAIAIEAKRSESYVRQTLARRIDSPIKRDSDGSLFVYENDLYNYFQKLN